MFSGVRWFALTCNVMSTTQIWQLLNVAEICCFSNRHQPWGEFLFEIGFILEKTYPEQLKICNFDLEWMYAEYLYVRLRCRYGNMRSLKMSLKMLSVLFSHSVAHSQLLVTANGSLESQISLISTVMTNNCSILVAIVLERTIICHKADFPGI